MKKIPLYLLMLGLFLCTVYAQGLPQQQITTTIRQLIILYPKTEMYQKDYDLTLHFHVLNSSGSLLTNINYCTFHLYNSTNSQVLQTNLTLNDLDYQIDVSNFTSRKGVWSYSINCDGNNSEYGYLSHSYTIGELLDTSQNDNSVIAVALIMLGLPFLLLYLSSKFDTRADYGSAVPLNAILKTILMAGVFLSMVVLLLILYGITLSYSMNDAILKPVEVLFQYGLWTLIILLFVMTFAIGFNLLFKAYQNLGTYFQKNLKK